MFRNIDFLLGKSHTKKTGNFLLNTYPKSVFTIEIRYVWTGPRAESEYFFGITSLVILISVIFRFDTLNKM